VIELVAMTPAFVAAVLADRRREAAELLEIELPNEFPSDGERRFLASRLRQMHEDVRYQQWCAHVVVLDGQMIGHAGFHGPPGVNALQRQDAVEYGYTIYPAWRRRGYATEAARLLMDMAEEWAGISHFVLSVAPDNAPSLAIVHKFGFVKTGEHMDEEDGLEHVFELER
jgi:[ribosomal protein S5]-alanine N-acetyltransferase